MMTHQSFVLASLALQLLHHAMCLQQLLTCSRDPLLSRA